jgi:NADH-quinone oxidoreductase subunit K
MGSFGGFWNDFSAWLPHVQLAHFLVVSAILFSFGIYAIASRRNAIMVLMGVELVLNAANINFIAFSRYSPDMNFDGQVAAIFVIILAAAEAAIGLAIVLNIYHRFQTVNVDEVSSLKE